MKLFKRIIAILLCVVMAVSVASCGADTSWVAKTDSTTTSAGLYMYYLVNAYSNAVYMVEDAERDVLKQKIENMDAAEWIKQNAMENLKYSIAVKEMFEAEGLTLSAENEQYATQMASYYWAYAQEAYTSNGIAYETILTALRYQAMLSQLFEHLYGKGGEREIPEDEVKKGLVDNYAKIKEIGISLAGISGEMRSDKMQETLKQKAEDYKTRIEAGEKIEDLIKEHYNYELDLAVEESGKTAEELLGGNASEIDTDFIVVSKDATNYSATEIEELFKLETGETRVAVEKEYIRVVQRFDILEDNTYLEKYDISVRATLKSDEFTKELEGIAEKLNVEINEAALKKYKPSKVKL